MDPGCEFLKRAWCDRLHAYHCHSNDEHLEALVGEVSDFLGTRVLRHLPECSAWASCDEVLRTAALLYLIDRGVVKRTVVEPAGVLFRPVDLAEFWILSRPELLPVAMPLLELVACLRRDCSQNAYFSDGFDS